MPEITELRTMEFNELLGKDSTIEKDMKKKKRKFK